MASKEISDLTAAAALTGTEKLHVDQGGNSRRTTAAEVAALALQSPAYVGKNWVSWDGVSDSVASGNAAAIASLIDTARSTGKTLVGPTGTWPLDDDIVIDDGDFRFVGAPGFKLLRQYNGGGGAKQGAIATLVGANWYDTAISNVLLENIIIESDIDGGTSNPYTGNGVVGYFADSELNGIRVENYWGDQAFLIGLDRTTVNDPYAYTDDTSGGTGLFRIVRCTDALIYGLAGQSGDDGAQFVPLDGLAHNCINSRYIGVRVKSLNGRAIIALLDTNCTGEINGCGFSDVVASAANRVALFGSYNDGAQIKNLTVDNCVLDQADQSSGSPESIYVRGEVLDSDINIHVRNPYNRLLRIVAGETLYPDNNRISVVTNEAPSSNTLPYINVEGGDFNQITARIVAPSISHVCQITGGEGNSLKNSLISGVGASQRAVNVTGGTKSNIVDNTFRGSGTSIYWAASPAGSGYEFGNDLGGMSTAGTAPAVRTNARA